MGRDQLNGHMKPKHCLKISILVIKNIQPLLGIQNEYKLDTRFNNKMIQRYKTTKRGRTTEKKANNCRRTIRLGHKNIRQEHGKAS